jgi:hypothetical protein
VSQFILSHFPYRGIVVYKSLSLRSSQPASLMVGFL